MRTLLTPMLTVWVGLYCILVNGAVGLNSSSSVTADGDISNDGALNSGGPQQVNDVNASNGDGPGIDSSSSTHLNTNNGQNTYYYNNNQNQRINAKYDDEQTYLDLFGERAKELLTQHIIPSTDAECHWDWRMGRCEPYCSCAFQFLFGDYHLGRSCRFRPVPPPSQFANDESGDDADNEDTPWQEAWQEVWHSQIIEGGSADDASGFVPPLFPKGRPDVVEEATATWDRTNTICDLPPESHYIQMIHKLTRAFTPSTLAIDKFHKLKNATSAAVDASMVHGRHHWKNMRRKACETVKSKVEERAQARDQPVVLTRQGATWIRRVCGDNGQGNIVSADGAGDAAIDPDDAEIDPENAEIEHGDAEEDATHDELGRCGRGECT